MVACDNETCLALDIRMNRLSVVLFDCKEYTTVNELYKRRDLDEFGTGFGPFFVSATRSSGGFNP